MKITIDYDKRLSLHGVRKEFANTINGDENVASATVFNALIDTCINIYMCQFILGGSYSVNTEDKLAIGDSLKNIKKILEKYQEPDC